MLRMALLASLLLLASVASGAVDPHPRASPEVTMDAPITAFAMANGQPASTAASLVAGRSDPTTTSGETPHVWRAWGASGDLMHSRTADQANCVATPVVDGCVGNVVAVAISDAGDRMAVLAQDDDDDGRLILATPNAEVVRLELAEVPSTLAMNADGTRVAVGVERGESAGRVHMYAWGGSGTGTPPSQPLWSADTDFEVTAMSIGGDGRLAAAANDRHYRFSGTGTAYEDDISPVVRSVAFARAGPDHWSVAGTSDGIVLLYRDANDVANPVPHEQPGGTASQNAVAMTRDATLFAAGDSAGVLRLYRNVDLVPGTYPVATAPALPAGITNLQFSQDGRYLVASAGPTTVLFRTSTTALSEVWRDTGGATVLDVGINADGTQVAAAAGDDVRVFTTVASATVTAPAASVPPGQTEAITLTVRNTGNREETIALSASAPVDWTATLSASSITLMPDRTGTVTLEVTAPGFAPPGEQKVTVTHRIQGVPTTTDIPVTVEQVHRFTLQADGPVSRAIDAGGSVRFPVRVQNLGNGADEANLDVVIRQAGWTATADPASLQLAAGAVGHANVTIEAPEDAGNGATGVADVAVEEDGSATLQLAAAIGARFGVAAATVPGSSSAAPGEKADFTLRITNTGNVPDTYRVAEGPVPAGWTLTADEGGLAEAVPPGGSLDLPVEVASPSGASAAAYELNLVVTSIGDPARSAMARHTLTLEGDPAPTDDAEDGKKKKGSPGPGPLLGLAAVALAAFLRRR